MVKNGFRQEMLASASAEDTGRPAAWAPLAYPKLGMAEVVLQAHEDRSEDQEHFYTADVAFPLLAPDCGC